MTSNKNIYDVIVAGAGPAGSTSARELSQKGYKVLLIDKKSFPRKKTCGGLIPVKALRELDFTIPSCYIKNEINKLSVYSNKMKNTTYENKGVMAITTLREEVDHHLLNRAIAKGVEFYEETAFEKLSHEKEYINVYTTKGVFSCMYVIGCDGVFSKVKNYVDSDKGSQLFKMGFSLNTSIPLPSNWANNEFKVYQTPVMYTMGWAIPCNDHINMGIGGPWINNERIMKYFPRFLEEANDAKIKKNDYTTNGGFLPAGGLYRKIYKDGIILAGDAGGFVDPLTGEGFYYAIRSGKIAANQIIKGEPHKYEKICYSEFNSVLRKSLAKNLLGINKIYSKNPFLRQKLCESFSNTMH